MFNFIRCKTLGIMIGQNRIFLESVDSTNTHLLRMLENERLAGGTLIHAGFQTAGRGADNSNWESEAGSNLTFSFVLYPDFLAAEAQFALNKFISLGIADFLSDHISRQVKIKWPNDIYVDQNKIAGILVQNGIRGNSFQFSIIGIGLNVNQLEFSPAASRPVSMRMVTGKNYDLEEILDQLCQALDRRYSQLASGGMKALDEDYLHLLYRYGEVADYEIGGERCQARISGISKYGRLVLEISKEKILECDMKEVVFL